MRRTGKRCAEPMMGTDTGGGASKVRLDFSAALACPANAPTVSDTPAFNIARRSMAVMIPPSMIVARHGTAAAAHQEIEIRAFARLVDVLHVELDVAARRVRLRRLPFRAPPRELRGGYMQMQFALSYIQLD